MDNDKGIIVVPKNRKVLFTLIIDITPGKLPRRISRFYFHDQNNESDTSYLIDNNTNISNNNS